ncbi:MAG: DUF4838 domain-containing protein, partial [Ruminococcaceae bacterium]|nr:DUF4838 domain-containing protein [Oscillospiraceae bacterium]
GAVTIKDINKTAADTDSDDKLTTKDVLYIRQMLGGMIDKEGNNTDDRYKVDSITIDNKNISRYTIVIDDEATKAMNTASGILKRYIRNACGISLNVATEDQAVDTYQIKMIFDADDEFELGKEGYRIAVDENSDVLMYCGTLRGPIYATYFFLEELVGYRFLFGGIEERRENEDDRFYDCVEYLYEAENINIPKGYDETDVPAVKYRAVNQLGLSWGTYHMFRCNAQDGGGIAQEEYGWSEGTLYIHAHSYEYQCGISPMQQPCLTSEETFEQVIDWCLNLIEERKSWPQLFGQHWTQISCSPNDNTNFCNCMTCTAIYKIEGSIAGTVFRLSNRVADYLDDIIPEIEVYTIAYWDARNPPLMTRPAENVCVHFCVGGCNNHTYDCPEDCIAAGGNPRLDSVDFNGNTQPQSNALDLEYFERWMELTNNVYIWYYGPNYHYFVSPSANIFNVYNDFKYAVAAGACGIYSEGNYGLNAPYYSFEYLRGYMASRMMWNPYMSEEEFNDLVNEYLMIYFGEGWEYIREYLEMAHAAGDANGCWTNNYDRPWNLYNEDYFEEHYAEMASLFDAAIAAASDETYVHRLTLCRMHCDFLGLSATYERDYVNGDANKKAAYEEAYAALYNNIVTNEIRLTSYGSGKYAANNFPSSAEDIYNPMEWLDEGFTGRWEWDGVRWQ